MAAGKEIRTKINSVKNTQKITSAMEMVAASKMRKAQENMLKTRPYADHILQMIGHLEAANPEYTPPLMRKADRVEKICYLVVSSDRGLCGGLNTNMFRELIREIGGREKQGHQVSYAFLGGKGVSFFKNFGHNLASATQLGDYPKLSEVLGVVNQISTKFVAGELDEIYLVSNRFVNTMTQKPRILRLLPFVFDESIETKHQWDYFYEPSSEKVLDLVLGRYLESVVYQAILENIACEQAARMIAMKSATDNASDLIDQLQLEFNKARQAAITQELSEIVSGAAAV